MRHPKACCPDLGGHPLAGVGVIFDQQGERLVHHLGGGGRLGRDLDQGELDLAGQGEGESRALPELTFNPDPTAVHLDEAAAERQPEPGALVTPGVRGIHLLELAKQLGQVFGLDPDAGVFDRDGQTVAVLLHRQHDLARGRRDLDRVG